MNKKIHELSLVFPEMEKAEFENLKKSIKKNGLREEIIIYKDEIIDGRHRYKACLELGIEPTFIEYKKDDILQFVLDKNLERRHLSASQKAMLGAEIANIERGYQKTIIQKDIEQGFNKRPILKLKMPIADIDNKDLSISYDDTDFSASSSHKDYVNKSIEPITQKEVADKLGISIDSIQQAKIVKNSGSDELVNAVRQGNVSVSVAKEIAELPKEEQIEVVAKGEKEILKKAKEIKQTKLIEKAKKKEEEKQVILETIKKNNAVKESPLIDSLKQSYINANSLVHLKKIADGSIDLVITDPPYGIDYHNNRREVSKLKTENGIANDGKDNIELLDNVIQELYRTLKDGRHLYWFGRNDVIYPQLELLKKHGFTVKNVLIWLKNNHGTGDLQYSYASRYEVCVYAIKDVNSIKGTNEKNRQLLEVDGKTRHDDILEYSKVASNDLIHDHQKPTELLQFLINKSSYEGETVLDPFAGSGSTVITSLLEKRKALGIELDQEIHSNSLCELMVKYA